jgi:twinkle protein
MAEMLSPDEIDFPTYARETEAKAKVRRAAEFADDLYAAFQPRDHRTRTVEMFSTKLRGCIEFRPGEVTAWAGYNGHRKSMFTGQLALDLCVQRRRVLMCSLEMAPRETLKRMARQCFAVAEPARASLERFMSWTDGRLWIFDHVGRLSPTYCMAVIRYFAEELEGTEIVIDSMMMVCASEEHLDEQKQFTTDIVRAAQEFGVHIHLITHCRKPASGEEKNPPSKYDLRGSAAISDQAHNVITIWANKAKKSAIEAGATDDATRAQPDALVTVEKQRNGAFEGRVKLWFDEASLRFMDSPTSVEPYVLREAA